MAREDYTTPLVREMGDYSPVFVATPIKTFAPDSEDIIEIPYQNRADKRKVNEHGQVYEADVFVKRTVHNAFDSTAFQNEFVVSQFTFKSRMESPACILAVPRTYGNLPQTAINGIRRNWAGAILEFHEMENFLYFLVVKLPQSPMTFTCDNVKNGYHISGLQKVNLMRCGNTIPYPSLAEPLSLVSSTVVYGNIGGTGDSISVYVNNNFTQLPDTMDIWNSNAPQGSKYNSVSQDFGVIGEGTIAALRTGISHWKDRTDSVVNSIYYTSDYLSGNPVLEKTIGTMINTGLPVFSLHNMEEMVKYFQGEPYQADNDVPPPDDWSTDWDIYIKGSQKPDIYITMKSDNLNEWLENADDNTSGMAKEDIKVEYRYKVHGSVGDNDIDSDKYFPWLSDMYNETRATSYMENIQLNFGNADVTNGGSEFSDYTIAQLMSKYAQLEFRLHYGEYKSTWCRYKIGVIGSPSIPDFVKMQNEGMQDDEWQDESTVTLHYDVYPPDYDPYPFQPEPPAPPPENTDPVISINGTGLLTTTYKITESQAKALGRFLWGGDFFQKLKALNMSPIENIVGLCYMPIGIDGSESVIVIGNVDTNINGEVIGNTTPLYTLGSVNLEGRYKSFLDYAPYTEAHIFLPFVGFKPIDPQVFTGKTLSVKYSYDIISGVCNAMLFANGIYIESHQGNCGIDIPLVASNRAEVVAGLIMSLAGAAVSPITAGGSLALDVMGMGSDIANAASSFHSSRQGNYSPTCAWSETRQCFLVLETPNVWYPSTYNHDYGRPCMTTYTIGQLSGFTVCDQTIDVSGIGRASEAEKREIREILTTGFYA